MLVVKFIVAVVVFKMKYLANLKNYMTNTSLIKNRNKVKQVVDFTGVQNGLIHPSDIDGVLEFDNKILILIEVKRRFKRIPPGQRLLLERLCDAWHDNEKSIVLKVEHEFDDENIDIPLEQCKVTRVYYKKHWVTLPKKEDFKYYLNRLGKTWDCEKCKF